MRYIFLSARPLRTSKDARWAIRRIVGTTSRYYGYVVLNSRRMRRLGETCSLTKLTSNPDIHWRYKKMKALNVGRL